MDDLGFHNNQHT